MKKYILFFLIVFGFYFHSAFCATITVNSTADSGPGTLRQALLDAMNGDIITFDPIVFPPASPATIALTSGSLPTITQGNLTIDASNAGVILDGSALSEGIGISIESDHNVIKGLQILNFPSAGIDIGMGGGSYNIIGGSSEEDRNIISGNSGNGVGIYDPASEYNIIIGNYIGTDVNGINAIANLTGIAIANGATNNTIGGSTPGERNIISGNLHDGINISGVNTDSNSVKGNYIGLVASGTSILANGDAGINISSGASNNTIGGNIENDRNVICGNTYHGIKINDIGTRNNVVIGNYIGVDFTGITALPNGGNGVEIGHGASDNTIGGTTPGERNIISASKIAGVHITDPGSENNVVKGNFIGTDISGTAALPNQSGVAITGEASYNTIGGSAENERNVISGNSDHGIIINGTGTTNNVVFGNYIGVDITGIATHPNGGNGIEIGLGANNNTIGGTSPGQRNIISGNKERGIHIAHVGTNSNSIAGNYIGTDVNGTNAIQNEKTGISIDDGAKFNTIGGNLTGHRNIISGNSGHNIEIYGTGTDGNVVKGNYIGIDVTGMTTLESGINSNGVYIGDGSKANTIGGVNSGEQNIIGGHTWSGIAIQGVGSDYNLVIGNYIGTDTSGLVDLGNEPNGVVVLDGARHNQIGGRSPDSANTIAYNNLSGVRIREEGSDFNRITQNSIYSNDFLGINIEYGANLNVSAPVLTSFDGYIVTGSAAPNATVEFFADAEDEGKIFIDAAAADGSGNFSKSLDITGVPGAYFLTATQDVERNTSEFSATIQIPPLTPQNLTATTNSHRIRLNWDRNSESDLYKYNIYRNKSSPAITLIDSVMATPPQDTIYYDYNVVVDTTYYYRISAVDSAGNESIFSNEVNAFASATDIAVSPTALDFGVIQIPDDKTLTINVANLGNWELLVDSTEIIGSDSIQFEMVSGQGGFNIPVGGNPHPIRIRFAPTSGGIKNAKLRIISNDLDENPLDVNLSGTAIKPEISVLPDSLNFGDVVVDSDSLMTLTVSNQGQMELIVDSTKIVGPDSLLFNFIGGQNTFSIPPGGNPQDIIVQFSPIAIGFKSAILRIYSNDFENNPLDVPMSGQGVLADIFVFPDSLGFGNVLVLEDSVLNIDITNRGGTDLIVDSTVISGTDTSVFSLITGLGSFVLRPNDPSYKMKIQFSPIELGFKSATARIYSNDPDENPFDIPLTGTGVQPKISVGPESLQFDSVYINYKKVLNVTIGNLGDGNLKVSSAMIVGSDAQHFAVVSAHNNFIVPPFSVPDTIKVQFAPKTVGSKIAALQISSNDPVDNLIQIPLLGEGIFPNFSDIVVDPDSLDFGNVEVNRDSILNLSVSNNGGIDLVVDSTAIVGTDATFFSFVSGQDSFTVLAGGVDSHIIVIRFLPTSSGLKKASLRITSNDSLKNPFDVSLRGISFVPDADGPVINNIFYPDSINLNTSIPVSADVSDLSAINEVHIFYKISGAPVYTKDQMFWQSGSTYTATIPAVNVTEKGIEFYLYAQDEFLNSSLSSAYYIKTILPTGLTNTMAQPAGNALSDYRIFSLPIDLDDPLPATFIESNPKLGDYDQVHYRLYDVQNGSLKEYPNIGNFLPGKGFLFITNISDLKLGTSKGKSVDSSKPFKISLPARWSLIGNPYYFNIPFDSLSASTGYFELQAFIADSGWMPNTSGLEPWKGYAIRLGQAGDFIINPSVEGLNKPSNFYSVESNDNTNWLIQISADNGLSIDHFNFIGQNEHAEDIYDKLDLHEAPRIGKRVSMMFLSKNTEGHRLTTDIRATSDDGHIWDITCLTDPKSEYLSLSFKGIDKIPNDFDVFVLEQATNSAYNLKNYSDMKFASSNVTEIEFKLMVGTKEFLNSLQLNVELYPKEFDLLQNFPNPFNSSTTIRYQLPTPGDVQLDIHNILGQKVETVINKPQPAGYHNFIWDISQKKDQIASGVYFLRLTVKGVNGTKFEKTKKMLYVK